MPGSYKFTVVSCGGKSQMSRQIGGESEPSVNVGSEKGVLNNIFGQ